MRLFIIGNGFDLHHGLKTSYRDYALFLQTHYPDVLDNVQNSPYFDGNCDEIWNCDDPFWTDVENNLKFNFDLMLEESVGGYYPNWREESDARWHRAEFDAEAKARTIDSAFATYALANWIQSVDVLNAKTDDKIRFLPSDIFVSFNYTETLERVYNIQTSRVLHIHGCITNPDLLQFGNPEQTPSVVRKKFEEVYGNDEYYGMSVEPAGNVYVSLAEIFSKDIDSNIPKLEEFIAGKKIDEVVIMGHSFFGVDKPYYEKVLVSRYRKCKWTFFCHIEKDEVNAQKFIDKYGLNGEIVRW